ncbi:hypothetical protein DFJ43DRAFT_640393 [Lentinula guzmanii]|uniref:Uncharacterized protein n=1 Tax=Lentinula guzmanii TaxID=2804957 RepID=A0AA38JAX9_9AGAR|nr:hypothetical protein DFJ43DRAFT_640393 [Lentinula guzmanii]
MDLLFSSSPVQYPYSPSTPSSNRIKSYSLSRSNHKPLNSSPLAGNSSPMSSPVAEAQARRQSQYKSRVSSGPQRSRPGFAPNSGLMSRVAGSSSAGGTDSQNAMLRDRFKQRCLERAEKARAKAHAAKRRSGPDSDVFDAMDDDIEEDDEDVIQGEFYQRIMMNQARQQRHAYLRSYYAEVGSSFDPDLEDAAAWERELHAPEPSQAGQFSDQDIQETVEMTPEELEQAELEAYAEECERRAALADFEDIPFDELFDDEEVNESLAEGEQSHNGDDDMDIR